MKNTIIFDLDGLLIDSERITCRLYQHMLSQYGCSLSLSEYAEYYSGKTAVENMTDLVNAFRIPLTVREGLNRMGEVEQRYLEGGIPLKKGAGELLFYLKENKYKTVLASSSTEDRAIKILGYHHLTDIFDAMVFGAEVKRGKPEPDVFLKACEKIKEPAENCLVLEDSEAGIQAAFAAGIPVICIPDVKKPAVKYLRLTAAVLDSLAEVKGYLEKDTP